ncbi:MAG: N-6 DNA methylase [Thermomicrobiales bacterium]|nr:N-6 DNA methylase [Thermomicrobiales bacterium]
MPIAKAQKIIDRVVFAAFAEDKGLLPDLILQRLKTEVDNSGTGRSLWGALRDFFDAIDVGSTVLGIPEGYNGGLFAPDPELESLRISYEPLAKVVSLGTYNFREDLSVNVLGHLFEQSISDLEAIRTRELGDDGTAAERNRRKKDGIFYTPEYIVRYIVEHALGTYLRENEERIIAESELVWGLNTDVYEKRQREAYEKYLEFLRGVKVVDPACGSGAFLVHVLDYLLTEHHRVAAVLGTADSFDTAAVHDEILRSNIYGVDLNEESIEIAKLSLWLKTASRGKKLTSLDHNLKVGNSLIDDPAVAGDKAFNWSEKFPEVFARGGFDVVVMNPPYVQMSKLATTTEKDRAYLIGRYGTSGGRLNTFIFFIHLLCEILSGAGRGGFIVPNTLLTQQYYRDTRSLLIGRFGIQQIISYPNMPFEGAVVENVSMILDRHPGTSIELRSQEGSWVEIDAILPVWRVSPPNFGLSYSSDPVIDSIDSKFPHTLSEIVNINQAIALKGDKSKSVTKEEAQGDYRLLDGRHMNRYSVQWGGDFLIYDKGRIHSGGRKDVFLADEKLMFRRVSSRLVFAYDADQYFALNTIVVVTAKPNYPVPLLALLPILNSRLLNYHYVRKYKSTKKVFSEIQARTVGELPIPNIANHSSMLTDFAHKRIARQRNLESLEKSSVLHIQIETGGPALSARFSRWWELDFPDFVAALNRKLSLGQRESLLEIYEKYRPQLLTLDAEIQRLEAEIDQFVYDLYELTPEEIALVEASV